MVMLAIEKERNMRQGMVRKLQLMKVASATKIPYWVVITYDLLLYNIGNMFVLRRVAFIIQFFIYSTLYYVAKILVQKIASLLKCLTKKERKYIDMEYL